MLPDLTLAPHSRSPVCTSHTLICPSLRPVANTWQHSPAAPSGCRAAGQALKARPHTIWPHSKVFSLAPARLHFASALWLLRSEALQLQRNGRTAMGKGHRGRQLNTHSTACTTHSSVSCSGHGISLTRQWPCDQANQAPSDEKATLHVSQLDFQSYCWGRPGFSSASSTGSSGQRDSGSPAGLGLNQAWASPGPHLRLGLTCDWASTEPGLTWA